MFDSRSMNKCFAHRHVKGKGIPFNFQQSANVASLELLNLLFNDTLWITICDTASISGAYSYTAGQRNVSLFNREGPISENNRKLQNF